MKKSIVYRILFLSVFTVLILSACASEPTTMSGMSVDDHASMDTEIDEMFIDMMVPHHQGALAMAEIALDRSQRSEIREMAEAILGSQKSEIDQMIDWKQQWYGSNETPPMSAMPMLQEMPEMSSGHVMDMQADVDALQNASEPFDLAFIDAMVPHHQSAIDAAQLVIDSAVHAEIKDLARQVIDAQQREIDQMLAWRETWFPDAPSLE